MEDGLLGVCAGRRRGVRQGSRSRERGALLGGPACGLHVHAAALVLHAIIPKPQQLDLEAGAGLQQREDTASQEDDFATARVAGLYKYFFQEKSSVEGFAAWVFNLDDTDDNTLEWRASLSAPVLGGLSLALGYNSLYRSQPLPGLEKVDWTVSAGVQFTY